MRYLLHTCLLIMALLFAMLFFWRPAQDLVSLVPVDWALEYEKQHTAGETMTLFGRAREVSRTMALHQPLTEYIQKKIGDMGYFTNDPAWIDWRNEYYESASGRIGGTAYLSCRDPLIRQLALDRGNRMNGYVTVGATDSLDVFRYQRLEPDELSDKDIRADLRYPYRMIAFLFALLSCLLLLLTTFRKDSDKRLLKTSSGRGVRVFITIGCVGIAGILLPFLYGWVNDAPPFVFLGGFLLVFGMIGVVLFGLEVMRLSQVLHGKGLLAHWTYTDAEWQAYKSFAHAEAKASAWKMLLLITCITVVVCGGFWLTLRDEGATTTILFMAGFIVLLWIAVGLSVLFQRSKGDETAGEVYLADSLVFLNGSVFAWFIPGARLESVSLEDEVVPVIRIVYSTIRSAGRFLFFYRQNTVVYVPIPSDRWEEAKTVVKGLAAPVDRS